MPAKNVSGVMVYLNEDDRSYYQTIADREGSNLSAICRRVLKAERDRKKRR